MKNTKPHIEVVLPVFNEVRNVLPLLRQIDTVAEKLKDQAKLTVLFVDDGSSDGTSQLLYRLHKERADVKVVSFVHNFGHAAALAAGVDHVDADIAVFMDADGQDSPEHILPMFEAWKKGAKTVVAERGERGERNRWAFEAFYFLLHKMAKKLPRFAFGTFCLLDKTVIERMRKLPERNRYFPGLVSYASGPIVPIRVERETRLEGESRVGTWGLINLALTAYVSFSTVPVRLVSMVGFFASGVGFLAAIGIVGVKLFTARAIPGWASLMTTMSLAAGVQLLCLGIIGEYVARIYEEAKNRPLYMVDRFLEKKSSSKAA